MFVVNGASCNEGIRTGASILASAGRSGVPPTVGRPRRSAPQRFCRSASAGTHSFTYDANGNQITRDGASQAWASFNLPVQVAQPIGGTTYLSQFSYGPDHQRWKQVASYSNGTETTYYVGGLLEKESPSSGATQWRHYVHLPSGMVIVVARASNNQKTVRYLLVDHLGSTDKVLDEAGAIVASYSYGVYGNRRGSDWSGTAPDWSGIANSTRHGYTGHEHLDNLLLIHMNGRVYDPGTGRFLSVDPILADLGDSQQVNPYAYVGNRPLEFTDPSGFSASADDEQNSSDTNYTFYVDVEISMKGVGRWLHRVGSGIAHFLGFNQDPPPPPATVMQGQSAQSGINPCGAGKSSPACGGVRIEASPDAAGPPGTVYATTAVATAEALEHSFQWEELLGARVMWLLRGSPYVILALGCGDTGRLCAETQPTSVGATEGPSESRASGQSPGAAGPTTPTGPDDPNNEKQKHARPGPNTAQNAQARDAARAEGLKPGTPEYEAYRREVELHSRQLGERLTFDDLKAIAREAKNGQL